MQWWIFALFALWMWGRMVRDETRRARAEEAADAEGPPSGEGGEEETPVGEGGRVAAAPADRLPVTAGDNGARDDA